MTDLASAVVSITPTRRRRFFWAAWWTHAPQESPFRKPDACNGGAGSFEEALAEAQRVADRHLVPVEPYWARAWNRVLRGEVAPARPDPTRPPKPSAGRAALVSSWSVLGVEPGATLDAVRRAFRLRAQETHPDHGGDAEAFLAVRRAYERLVERLDR